MGLELMDLRARKRELDWHFFLLYFSYFFSSEDKSTYMQFVYHD